MGAPLNSSPVIHPENDDGLVRNQRGAVSGTVLALTRGTGVKPTRMVFSCGVTLPHLRGQDACLRRTATGPSGQEWWAAPWRVLVGKSPTCELATGKPRPIGTPRAVCLHRCCPVELPPYALLCRGRELAYMEFNTRVRERPCNHLPSR